jgi:hypothetical protein
MGEPVLFLDIDGVLNSQGFFGRRNETRLNYRDLDPSCIECLNEITAKSGARIVVSSTWRLTPRVPELVAHLKGQGIVGEIIGRTPRLHHPAVRGDEIFAWMESQLEWPRFAILDDDSDMSAALPWLVQTDTVMGLVRPDVARVLATFEMDDWGTYAAKRERKIPSGSCWKNPGVDHG